MQKGKNLVLVTHQVNISALSGRAPAMGEAMIMRHHGNAWQLVGQLKAE
jgi:broad specificity phosphatase PhoE